MTNWKSLHGSFFEGTRVLVTGGAGFIGSHLTEALIELGATIVVLDDLSGGDLANLESFRRKAGESLQIRLGTIVNADTVDEAIAGCRYVFHQAALGSVPRSVEMPMAFHEANVTGTMTILEAARRHNAKRVVFAASSSAYGDSVALPKIETMRALPKSPYAATKVACEALMQAYASCYSTDTACLRYFNIFGPRQNSNSAYAAVIAAFARALFDDVDPTIHGDGLQSRDFTFVENAFHANLLAARCSNRLGGAAMNVACGQSITVNQLLASMARLFGRTASPRYVATRSGDVKHSLADLTLARRLIGYESIVPFELGLAATCTWYRQQFAAPDIAQCSTSLKFAATA